MQHVDQLGPYVTTKSVHLLDGRDVCAQRAQDAVELVVEWRAPARVDPEAATRVIRTAEAVHVFARELRFAKATPTLDSAGECRYLQRAKPRLRQRSMH